MKKRYLSLLILILSNLTYTQLFGQNQAIIHLENGSSIEAKITDAITTKGFKGITVDQSKIQRYVKLTEIKSIEFLDKKYVKQKVKYESIQADILIASFVMGDIILYEGFQLNGEKLFFIGGSKYPEIIMINNKGMDNFFNYYFKDCGTWKAIANNQYVYSKDWLVKLAENNNICFNSSSVKEEELIIDYVPKKVSLAVGGRLNFYQVGINSSTNDYLYDPKIFDKDNGISFAGIFQVVFSDKVQVQQLVSWYKFRTYHGKVNYHPFSVAENYSELSLETSYLEFQTSAKVNIFSSVLTPYVEGGLNIGVLLNSTTEETTYQRVGYQNLPKDYYFNKRQIGPFFGTGLAYRINSSLRAGLSYQFLIHRFSINIRGENEQNPNINFGQSRHHVGGYLMYDL